MRVVIAGASGFLGTHLSNHLRVHGHEVTALVRREPASPRESRWDPSAGQVDDALTGAVSVIQRGDSALRLNVHFHVLALDGVYVRDAETGVLVFHALAARPGRRVAPHHRLRGHRPRGAGRACNLTSSRCRRRSRRP